MAREDDDDDDKDERKRKIGRSRKKKTELRRGEEKQDGYRPEAMSTPRG